MPARRLAMGASAGVVASPVPGGARRLGDNRGYGAQIQVLLMPWTQAPDLAPLLVQAVGGLAGGSQSGQ